MPMYNLQEYNNFDNYGINDNYDSNYYKINNKATTVKSFKYKTKIIGKTLAITGLLDVKVVIP